MIPNKIKWNEFDWLASLSTKENKLWITKTLNSPLFLEAVYQLVPNRRGGMNLWYNGYVYRKKIEYCNTINWVCLQNNCSGRVTTRINESSIKESKKAHNHLPKFSVVSTKM